MKNDELIDKYVLDRLNKEEKLKVDLLLKEDPEFKEDLEFRIQLSKAIRANEEDKLREILHETENKIVRNIWIKRVAITSVAAAIMFVMIFTYFKINDTDKSQNITQIESGYIDKYYETPSFLLSPALKGKSDKKQVEPAFIHFKNKDFNNACPLFEELLTLQPDNEWIKFYTGVTYMETSQYNKALEIFKALNYEGSIAEITSTWYIALIYLDKDMKDEARPLLEKIANGMNEFKEQADKILIE